MGAIETFGGDATGPENLVPQTLVDHQIVLADSIKEMLNGPAYTSQKINMLSYREGYQEALYRDGYRFAHHRMEATGDETITRADLVKFLVGSVSEIIGEAQSAHHDNSHFEKVRHYIELSRRRRLGASLVNAAVFSVVSVGAVKALEYIPSIDSLGSLAASAGVAGFVLRYLRPGEIIGSVVESSGDRVKDKAKAGINKHDSKVMRAIAQEVADIQDRNLSKRLKYEMIATEIYGPMVRVAVSDALLEERFNTNEQQGRAVQEGSRTAVEWLYALYGIDITKKVPVKKWFWSR